MSIRVVAKKNFPFFMMAPALLWQVLFFYIPLVLIIVSGFLKRSDTHWFCRLTIEHYYDFFSATYGAIIARSCILAVVNALLSILIAYPTAYYLARMKSRWKNCLLFFLILPFWTNFLVQVYAWFFVLEKHGLINSLLIKSGLITQPFHLLHNVGAIYLVMLYCYFPFAVMPIYSILEKLDSRMLEASYDLGATPFQTLYHIILPLSSSGIITGFFLVFIASFGEFVVPALLGGGKQMYVGTLISHFFLAVRNYYAGSAFTTLSICVLIMMSFLFYNFIKRFFWNSQGIR